MAISDRLSDALRSFTARLRLIGHFGVGTLTGNLTLTRSHAQIGALDPGGASRDVTLFTAQDGHFFVGRNTADAAGENLVVKNPAGTTLSTVPPGGTVIVACEDSTWFVVFESWTNDVLSERVSAGGVTIDGLRIKDSAVAPVAGGSAWADLSSCATGEGDIALGDNLADALTVREGANAYVTYRTTNDLERVRFGKLADFAAQTIDMADAQVKLVLGTAGAGEVKLTGQLLAVDANSGATEDLLLPAEASSVGLILFISNTGGEDIVVKEDSDTTTICTISTTESAFVWCDGTTWRGGVVSTT